MTMRKEIISAKKMAADPDGDWLRLEQLARAEISSEDPQHPLEHAVSPSDSGDGWRAAGPGKQSIGLFFDEPQQIRRIRLRFVESHQERSQEFLLRWTGANNDGGEIVRQQWNFNHGSDTEVEDLTVDLRAVTSLELSIDPDQGKELAFATLAELRVA
jgi:hypothetical protein